MSIRARTSSRAGRQAVRLPVSPRAAPAAPTAVLWARICSFALLLLLCGLVPLAQATPPDPSWIPGIYDAGDLDDAVTAILGTDGVAESDPRILGRPSLPMVGYFESCPAEVFRGVALQHIRGRAPPA